jgi:hypothetical protein
MLNEIIDGISLKLNQVFGDGYEVYGDTNIVQGLKEPCFFIALLNPTQTQIVGARYFRTNPFMIQYFAKNSEDNIELHNVASELFDALEYIHLLDGDSLRGTSMSYNIVDGVLNFEVNYNVFLTKAREEADKMEVLETDVKKEGD